MWRILQHDEGDDFVLATNETHTVREFVETAFGHVDLDWKEYVKHDGRYERPAEVDLLIGDASKAKKLLDWEPKVRFHELVAIMVDADMKLLASKSAQQQLGKLAVGRLVLTSGCEFATARTPMAAICGGADRNCPETNASSGTSTIVTCAPAPDDVVKLDHVARTHPHATVARRQTDVPLLRRSVNVNVAAVRRARSAASRPRSQRMRVTIGSRPGASGGTISPVRRRSLKTAPLGAEPPIFSAISSSPERSAAAARRIAEAELRSRNRISGEQRAIFEQRHPLFGHADDDVMTRVRRGAGSDQQHNHAQGAATEKGKRDPRHHRLNRKNSSAVSVVASRDFFERNPAGGGDRFRDQSRVRRFAAFPAKRHRREIRAIGFDHELP